MAAPNTNKRPRIIKKLALEQIKGEGSPQGVLYGLRGTVYLDILTDPGTYYEGQNSLTWTLLGPTYEAAGEANTTSNNYQGPEDQTIGILNLPKVGVDLPFRYLETGSGVVFDLSNNNKIVIGVQDATEDDKGIAQLATLPEVVAGVNAAKIVTPATAAVVYVPYTGANANVDLGDKDIATTGDIIFRTIPWWKAATTGMQTALVEGGFVTPTSGDTTKFDISAGCGYVVDQYSDQDNPTVTEVSWVAQIGVTPTYIATGNLSWVGMNSAGAIVQQATAFSVDQEKDIITLGILIHTNNVNITSATDTTHQQGDGYLSRDLAEGLGAITKNGNNYSAAAADLTLRKEAGTTFLENDNRVNNIKDPNHITSGVEDPALLFYVYNNGVGGVSVVAPSNDVDPDQYDDGSGVLQPVSNNRWTNQYIYFFPGNNLTFIRYGENVFSKKIEALAAIGLFTPSIIGTGFETALIRTVLTVKKGTSDIGGADNEFTGTTKFGLLGSTGGSGSGGVVQDLQDTYDNSVTPQIVTNASGGALSIRIGTGNDADNVFEAQNTAGAIVASVNGLGNAVFLGDVGIGIAPTNGRLHIKQTSDAYNKGIAIEAIGTSKGFIWQDDSRLRIQSSALGNTDVTVNATGSGLFGVGIAIPLERLHIEGGNVLISGISSTSSKNAFVIKNELGNAKFLINSSVTDDYLLQMKNTGNSIKVQLGTAGDSYFTGGNTGFGTTSPGYKLDVLGNTGITGSLFLSTGSIYTDNARYYYSKTPAAATVRMLGINGSNTAYVGPIDTGPITTIFNASTTSLNAVIFAGGLEGIKLDAVGEVTFKSYGLGNHSAGTPAYKAAWTSAGKLIEIPIGAGSVDGSGTTNYVTKWIDADTVGNSSIYDNGTNVGFGDSNPAYGITLDGDKAFYISHPAQLLISSSTHTKPEGSFIDSNTSRTLRMGIWDNAAIPAGIEIHATNNDLTSNYINFRAGGADVVRIDDLGNVGIGTATPLAKLQVGAGTPKIHALNSTTAIITETGTGTVVPLSIHNGNRATSDEALISFVFGNSWSATASIGAIVENGTTAATGLKFTTGSTEKMRIDGVGNVGIGTTAPAQKLDVQGRVRIELSAPWVEYYRNGVQTGIIGTGDDGQILSGVTSDSMGIRATNDMFFGTNGNNVRMAILSGGNVGIGTTAPIAKLHVKGISNVDVFLESTTASMWVDMKGANSDLWSWGATGNGLEAYNRTNPIVQFVIAENGNVGIGTTAPTTALDVNGVITANGGFILSGTPGGQGAQIRYISGAATANDFWYNVPTAGRHRFAIADVSAFEVNGSGNGIFYNSIGVGTTGPNDKIHIKGASTVSLRLEGGVSNSKNIRFYSDDGSVAAKITAIKNTLDFYAGLTQVSRFTVAGALRLHTYGAGIHSGTPTYKAAFDALGNLIEIPIGAGPVDGSGTTNYVTKWIDGDTVGDSSITDDGSQVVIAAGLAVEKNGANGSVANNVIIDGGSQSTISNGSGQVISFRGNANRFWGAIGGYTAGALEGIGIFAGISTALPSTPQFYVNSAGDASLGGTNAVGYANFTGLSIGDNNAAKTGIIKLRSTYNSGDGFELYQSTGGTTYFNVNSATVGMALLNNGNLGIGTLSPAAKLDVKGGAVALQLTTTDYVLGLVGSRTIFGFGAHTGNTYSKIQTTDVGGNSASNLVLQADSGNVGIGTTNPLYTLDVGGEVNIPFETDFRINSNPVMRQQAQGFRFGNLTGNDYIEANNGGTGNIQIVTNAVIRMTVDGTTGNVGIGVANPQSIFEVKKDVDNSSSTTTDSNTHILVRNSDVNGSAVIKLLGTSSDSGVIAFGGGSGLVTDKMHLTARYNHTKILTAVASGNVGIGTTNPLARVDIISPDGNLNTLRIGRADTGSIWTIGHAGNDFRLWNTDGTGSNILLGVDSSGNAIDNKVGIGTATPLAKLHIKDTANWLSNFRIESSNTAGGGILIDSTDAGAKSWGIISTGSGSDGGAGALSFWNADDGASRLYLSTGGNVGIGTTSPVDKLDVVGGNIRQASASGNGNLFLTKTGQTAWQTSAGTDYFIWLQEGGSELMRIQDTGNVGIGTGGVAPTDRLQVQGSSVSFKSLTSGEARHYFSMGDDGNNADFRMYDNGQVQQVNIETVGNSWFNGGNVGIGTTSPGKRLHVKDITGTYEVALFQTAGGGALTRHTDSTASVETGVQSGQWTARTSSVQRITIKQTGEVGIGTTTPVGILDVKYTGTGGSGIFGVGEGINLTSLSPNITFNDTSTTVDNYAIHLNQSIFTLGRYTSSTVMNPDLVLKAGNVGIGISPVLQGVNTKGLHIHNPTSTWAAIHLTTVTQATVNDGSYINLLNGAFSIVNTDSTKDITISSGYPSSATLLRIKPDKNLWVPGLTPAIIDANAESNDRVLVTKEWAESKGIGVGKFIDGTNILDAVYTDGNVGIGTMVPFAGALGAGGLHIHAAASHISGAKLQLSTDGTGATNGLFLKVSGSNGILSTTQASLTLTTSTTSLILSTAGATLNTGLFVGPGIKTATGTGLNIFLDDGTLTPISAFDGTYDVGAVCEDETSDLTTGTDKVTFRMPRNMLLTKVKINCNTAPTGSKIEVKITTNGTTIFSTNITIDIGEKTSVTASVPYVLSQSTLGDDSEIKVEIIQVGSTIPGKGLKLWLIGAPFAV